MAKSGMCRAFLAQLERARNISIIRLRRIAHAMDLEWNVLAQERNGRCRRLRTIALLGTEPEERRRAQAMLLEKFGVKSEENDADVGGWIAGAGKSTWDAACERMGGAVMNWTAD